MLSFLGQRSFDRKTWQPFREIITKLFLTPGGELRRRLGKWTTAVHEYPRWWKNWASSDSLYEMNEGGEIMEIEVLKKERTLWKVGRTSATFAPRPVAMVPVTVYGTSDIVKLPLHIGEANNQQ